MSKKQHLALEICYAKQISPFRAVIMTSQESRFINEQANLGFIKLEQKPTTIAIHKFRDNRLAIISDEEQAQQNSELNLGN